MTPADIAALLVAAASLLTAIGTLAVSIATAARLGTVQHALNGQTEHLVTLTRARSFEQGVQAERDSPGAPEKRPPGV